MAYAESFLWILQFLVACIVLPFIAFRILFRQHQHPPGPRGLPIIGNTHQAPRPFSWKWYEALRNRYGRIFRLRVLGDNFVILNDPKVAEDILGRRSINYSSRKFLPYAGYYRSGNRRMILMQYGEDFKRQRAAIQMLFRPEGVVSNRLRQEQQAKKFLFSLLNTPNEYVVHLKRYSAGIALGVTFGMSIEAAELEALNLLNNTAAVGADLFPGLWLVDMFPWLERLPDWLAPWRLNAIAKHEGEVELFSRFASHARPQRPGILQTKALVAQWWDMQEEIGLDDKSILYTGGSVGEAGTNTTACLLHCFLLACTIKPDVVRKAQEEIDRVVGSRAPVFADNNDMPFLFAVTKELLRWIPVTPLSFPHLASQDDEYDGLYIPQNSQVVASIWNMHRDPRNFSDPAVFDPMRWYDPTPDGKVREDASLFDGIWTFGFGRRSCPGKRLAVDSVWIAIAHLLWAFDIVDKDPENASKLSADDIDANLTWRDAVNIEPRVLDVVISPRTAEKAKKIREEWDAVRSHQSGMV